MTDISRILSAIENGDPSAAARLWPLVYDELRRLAKARLASEKPGQTLEATALVHEAYLRLVDSDRAERWSSRGHFFAAAAEAMRRVLVDGARRKATLKHGGGRERIELPEVAGREKSDPVDLLDLDEALRRLEERHPEKAQVVKLRFFAGLSLAEVARAVGLSRATVERSWVYARAWLHRELRNKGPG